MITHQQLNSTFVTPKIRAYLHKKISAVPSTEVDKRIEELLKFLNMAIYSKGAIPFSEDIDEIWHYWIMETQSYFNLCSKLCGGIYFHHSSNDYMEFDNPNVRDETQDMNRSFEILLSYILNYGDFQKDRLAYWPYANAICQHHFSGDLDQFNDWLKANLNVHTDRLALIA
jgi:hypothetical protein